MEVVDAIKGVAYVVGANGDPTKVEGLVGARPEIKTPKAAKTNYLYILIGMGLLIRVAMLILWKLRRNKRGKAVD
jgi:hypothetical protein